ncbi:MAG: type II toxin-antitoxin system VapB family antitoxin [bacterium]
MATNLRIDDKLIEEAVRLGGHETKEAAVTQALIEYTRRLQQDCVLSMFGQVDFDPDYDYKAQRDRS